MQLNRVSLLIAALMIVAGITAYVAKPTTRAADIGPTFSLDTMIPKDFGEWHEQPQRTNQVINPQTKELLDKLYSQILSRVYVNDQGYLIMLSVAYGADQRGSLQAHKPEVCYPAQGFTLVSNEATLVQTAYGSIPAQRLFTTLGARQEPVTYWFTNGDTVVQSRMAKRLIDLRFGLTGRIPDGLIFRVSSLDPDQARANQVQDLFINQLLQVLPPPDRKRLSGLSDPSQAKPVS